MGHGTDWTWHADNPTNVLKQGLRKRHGRHLARVRQLVLLGRPHELRQHDVRTRHPGHHCGNQLGRGSPHRHWARVDPPAGAQGIVLHLLVRVAEATRHSRRLHHLGPRVQLPKKKKTISTHSILLIVLPMTWPGTRPRLATLQPSTDSASPISPCSSTPSCPTGWESLARLSATPSSSKSTTCCRSSRSTPTPPSAKLSPMPSQGRTSTTMSMYGKS